LLAGILEGVRGDTWASEFLAALLKRVSTDEAETFIREYRLCGEEISTMANEASEMLNEDEE
jgi:hypothetical protein